MAYDKNIQYSEKYYDDTYEYRHVILPRKIVRTHPITRLLGEDEWRALGVCQSLGWVHYAIHIPEPEVMLFRRLRQDWNPSVKQQQQQSQAPQDGQEKEKKSDPQG